MNRVTPETEPATFDFHRDTFAFANETVWDYARDPGTGQQITVTKPIRPAYTLHCFVLARSTLQFLQHARFEPATAAPDESGCRRRIREVIARSPRRSSPESGRIAIPGYAGLRAFSEDHEALLKAQCGGTWQSYLQRSHWRMIFPFNRAHQAREARRLAEEIRAGRPRVVHAVRFPELTINHALFLFRITRHADRIEFHAYDPNLPADPVPLSYHLESRTFSLPALPYFTGGRVDIYGIFRGGCY